MEWHLDKGAIPRYTVFNNERIEMAMHYNYDREPRDIECPECGEDAYESVISIGRWSGEFHIKCDQCGFDRYVERDSPDLDAAIEARMGY